MITVSPATIVRRPVAWCGRAAFSRPAGHDRVVARPVGAVAAHPVLELVADVGLGRLVGEHRRHLDERPVGDLGGERHPGDLAGVLDASELLDDPARRLDRELLGEVLPRRVGDVLRLGEDRRRAGRRRHERLGELGANGADDEVGVEPAGLQVGGRAVPVPAVGDEGEPVGTDHDPTERPPEPGEPADVRAVRQQHRAPVERLPHRLDTSRKVECRQFRAVHARQSRRDLNAL